MALECMRRENEQIDYVEAWELQRSIHADVVAQKRPTTAIFLQHPATYTAGKRTEPHERPTDGTPVVDVDRGGKITWHGPGQLVVYPIVTLPNKVGVVDYVRHMEQAMIDTLAEYGVEADRVEGRSGAWLPADGAKPERKIGAIGIRVSHNTTLHGISLNLDSDLTGFGGIVPCGIADAGVGRLCDEIDQCPSMTEFADVFERHLRSQLSYA